MIPFDLGGAPRQGTDWGEIWNAAGPLVGVVIGALMTPWVAWHWQRKQSESDNKREEYRDLLDTLGACVQDIKTMKEKVYVRSKLVYGGTELMEEEYRESQERGSLTRQTLATLRTATRVFEDRLFIDEALKKHRIREDWNRMQDMAVLLPGAFSPPTDPEQKRFDPFEFEQKWQELADKIRRIAREDTG